MACMLLLLAAVDAGLGGWYFGIAYGESEVRRRFGIPDDRNVIGVVGLGYPGVDERPAGCGVLAHSAPARGDGAPQRLVKLGRVDQAHGSTRGVSCIHGANEMPTMTPSVTASALRSRPRRSILASCSSV